MRLARWIAVTMLCALVGVPRFAFAEDPPLIGFGPAAASQQRALESRFDAEIRRTDIHDWVQRLSSRPHHVGSP